MKKILMIDDTKDPGYFRNYDTGNLYTKDEVEICRTGEGGIVKLKEKKWDVLLLDHDLGDGITGMQVLNFLQVNKKAMPERIYLITFNTVSGPLMYDIIEKWHLEDLIKDHAWLG